MSACKQQARFVPVGILPAIIFPAALTKVGGVTGVPDCLPKSTCTVQLLSALGIRQSRLAGREPEDLNRRGFPPKTLRCLQQLVPAVWPTLTAEISFAGLFKVCFIRERP